MSFLTTYILPLIERIAPNWVARIKVNIAVSAEKGRRPHPFSLWTGRRIGLPPDGNTAATAQAPPAHAPAADPAIGHSSTAGFVPSDYVSWPSLVDRRYTGRHLPPCEAGMMGDLPPVAEVVDTLFIRPEGGFVPCHSTSTLFCFFAQWFTDSFLRTDPVDRRRNTSNHEIDYCQIYGLDERTTFALREDVGGQMRLENGFLPRLTDAAGDVRAQFHGLSYIRDDAPPLKPGDRLKAALDRSLPGAGSAGRWDHMYAAGLERGNSTILYTAISTMCVREHNRVAGVLAKRFAGWDDDRLFETARAVMIRNVLQIVVEDYINHLAGGFNFTLNTSFAESQPWYRSNRISLEFNLLYRWHSLVPDTFSVGGATYGWEDYRFNNALLERHGVEACINAASTQPAGRIQLHNTPHFLRKAEMATIDMARTFGLQSFTAYCERFGQKAPTSFVELVGEDNAKAAAELERLYGTIDRVELPVGLIAQTRGRGNEKAVLPPMIRTMVGVDAFTHIFTNPILAEQVHKATFEAKDANILDLIENTGGIVGLMERTKAPGTSIAPSFTVPA